MKKADKILHKMCAIQNYGTGKPDCFSKKEWESVTTKEEMKKKVCELWRQLKEVDPERADRVKPQNPYVA